MLLGYHILKAIIYEWTSRRKAWLNNPPSESDRLRWITEESSTSTYWELSKQYQWLMNSPLRAYWQPRIFQMAPLSSATAEPPMRRTKGEMLSRQKELPKLPVPPLKETVDKYLLSVQPFLTAEEMNVTKKVASLRVLLNLFIALGHLATVTTTANKATPLALKEP